MDLIEVFQVTNSNNSIEYIIYDLLKSIERDNYKLIEMSTKIILNAINIRERNSQDIAVFLNTFLEQNDDSFGGVITGVYYITTIQLNNESLIKSNPSSKLMQLAYDVNKEVQRFKEIVFSYLTKRITKRIYVTELFNLIENFGISNQFHDNLHDYLTQYHKDIVQYVVNILMGR